jgi:hypothetical protein
MTKKMSKYFCRSCGNPLFFKKVIDGNVAIPLEVEEYDEDDGFEVYNNKEIEFREIYYSHIECGECGSQDIDEETTKGEQ